MIDKEEQQETVIQGPGQILKEAREKAKLSTKDIADKMKLKRALIEDIEQDNYDINISLTFVRGYLKLYAKHVQVDETVILSAFEKLSTQNKEPAKLQSFSRRVANQANDDKLMLLTYLVVAVVIALVVIWWFQQSSSPVTNTSSTVTTNPVVDSEPESTVIQDTISQVIEPAQDTLASNTDSLISSQTSKNALVNDSANVLNEDIPLSEVEDKVVENQSMDEEVVDEASNLTPPLGEVEATIDILASPVELIFEFSGDCWMNLADATGENIAYGVKVKGRTMPVTGIPPFVVTLGAPEVVKISYAGEPLDMSFLPAGRIAKFDLPQSE